MSDTGDMVSRGEVLALAARIRELESQLTRVSVVASPLREVATGTDTCTACHTDGCTDCHTGDCTHCQGDMFEAVLLPGELERLSGAELVRRLQAGRANK